MDILLQQTLSNDNDQRQAASRILKDQEKSDYGNFLKVVCQILVSESAKEEVRMAAGAVLKNSISNKSQQVSLGWSAIDKPTKDHIKSSMLSYLSTAEKTVSNVTSLVIATIARIELPLCEWNMLIHSLKDIVLNENASSNEKQAALQIIGYICESVEPCLLTNREKNILLTAIIHGARRDEPSVDVRLTAMKSLDNSLEFISANFVNRTERDYIIKVVCDAATQHIHSTVDLQVRAYECLNHIIEQYYSRMEDYMSSSIFNLTVTGLTRTAEPAIVRQAIEFWSTVCDMEIQMKQDDPSSLRSFADQSIAYVLPNLLPLLIKDRNQEYKYDDDEECTIPTLAAHCLSLFALCSRELVLPETIKFLQSNLLVENTIESLVLWNQKEASIMAFGSIIQGPCPLKTKPLVDQILPTILSNFNDSKILLIRIIASQTLYKIIQQSIQVLDRKRFLADIINAIHNGLLSNQENIIHNSCLSIIHLSEQLKTKPHPNTTRASISGTGLSFVYSEGLLVSLLEITVNSDQQKDVKCRQIIYEAIASIIMYSNQDCTETVKFATDSALSRLEHLQEYITQARNLANKDIYLLESSLFGMLLSCIYRLSSKELADKYADRIIALVFQVSDSYFTKQDVTNNADMSLVVEDTYTLVSAMITNTGVVFEPFLLPLLHWHLPNLLKEPNMEQESQLCIVAVGIISDLYCNCSQHMHHYTPKIMEILFQSLSSKTLNPEIKSMILCTLGDIAHGIGSRFSSYVPTVIMVLKQAGRMQVTDKDGQDTVEYVDAIRVGVVKAFVGMIQGLDEANQKKSLLCYVNNFLLFVYSVFKDNVTRSDKLNRVILGLLGDVARIYRDQVQSSLVKDLLNILMIEDLKGCITFSKKTRETAHWAQQAVRDAYGKTY